MPAETIFMQWAPQVMAKRLKPTGFGKAEEIHRADNESSRAAITPEGWKICLRDADKNELYNLRSDPHEEHNLYSQSDQKGDDHAVNRRDPSVAGKSRRRLEGLKHSRIALRLEQSTRTAILFA